MEAEITTEAPKSKRPAFLIVLCILTFVGSSYSIYKAVNSYLLADINARLVSEAVEKASDNMGDQPGQGFLKSILSSVSSMSPDMLRKSAIISLVAALLTLAGGILMWGLRRYGFYIYIAGWLIAIIGTAILLGGTPLGIIGTGTNVAGALLFIILYGVNVKHLVK
jgi:hypothetical protein